MVHLELEERLALQDLVLRLEESGRVTRTFRRLDPDRQMAVIEALLSDAAEHGPEAMSVKRVAAAAGVSVGSLYQYFPHREGMLDFAAETAAGFLTGSLDAYRDQMAQLPLREGLLVYLSAGIEWSRRYQGLLRFFARVAYSGVPGYGPTLVRPVAESMRGMLRALLSAARARGELRPGLDLDRVTTLVHGLTVLVGDAALLPHLNDYLLLYGADAGTADDGDGGDGGDAGDRDAAAVREAVVDFVIAAIGARPGDGAGPDAGASDG